MVLKSEFCKSINAEFTIAIEPAALVDSGYVSLGFHRLHCSFDAIVDVCLCLLLRKNCRRLRICPSCYWNICTICLSWDERTDFTASFISLFLLASQKLPELPHYENLQYSSCCFEKWCWQGLQLSTMRLVNTRVWHSVKRSKFPSRLTYSLQMEVWWWDCLYRRAQSWGPIQSTHTSWPTKDFSFTYYQASYTSPCIVCCVIRSRF